MGKDQRANDNCLKQRRTIYTKFAQKVRLIRSETKIKIFYLEINNFFGKLQIPFPNQQFYIVNQIKDK